MSFKELMNHESIASIESRSRVIDCDGGSQVAHRAAPVDQKQGRSDRSVPSAPYPQLKVLNLILHLRKLKIPVRIIILKSRQTGVSTLVEADMYFEVLDRGIDGMVIAHKEKTSSKIHRMTKLFHERYDLPKPHLKTSNKEELTFFDHQGVLDVETANDKFAGSGVTPQYIHSTEEPKWKRGDETAVSLFQSLGYKPGTAHIRESTANGFDPLFPSRMGRRNCRLPRGLR